MLKRSQECFQKPSRAARNHRKWVSKIMILLLDLAGFKDTAPRRPSASLSVAKVTWDGFLYVTMQFCALSKLELCQAP